MFKNPLSFRVHVTVLTIWMVLLAPVPLSADDVSAERGLIQRIYLAYYARSADPAGLEYWLRTLRMEGGSLRSILAAFSAAPEFSNRYPAAMSNELLVDTVYRQLFNREPDEAGKAFYLRALAAGRLTRETLMLDILNGASGDDVPVLENKLAAAVYFTDEAGRNGTRFDEDTKQENIDLLAAVTGDSGSVAAATRAVDEYVGVHTPLAVIHINDHHSHLEPNTGASLTFGETEVDVETGGFARVVAKMLELDAAYPSSIMLHAGDAITGTIYYTSFKGQADADLMNQVCFDAFALGNHEFDDGDAGLARFLGYLNADPELCETAVLAANVVPEVGTPLRPTADTSLIEPYLVVESLGQQIGIIGIDIASKTKNSSSPLDSTEFLDETETAQTYIDELTARGVDRIVLLTHYQYRNDLALAANLRGADVIVGGDSHTLLGDRFADFGLNPQGPYPTVAADAEGNPVCIVQAWQYAEVVGELLVQFDRDGTVQSCSGTPHLLLGDTFVVDDQELEGAARQAVLDTIAATPELAIVQPDLMAEEALIVYTEQVEALQESVVGRAAEPLCLERIPGQGRSAICDVAATQANGGDIQQLVTQAFLERSFEADIALQNSGGVRIDIPVGEITIQTAFELLPFANTLVNMDMKGREVKQVLEEAVDNATKPDGSTGAYPYGANIRWHVDLSQPMGDRVTSIEIRRKGTDAWAPLGDDDDVKVVTNSFLAAGRDGWFTFGDVTDDGRTVDTFIDYAQAFIDFLQQDVGGAAPGDPILEMPPTIEALPCEDYSTQVFINADGVLQLPDPAVGRACEG